MRTEERLQLPAHLAGNVTLKTGVAQKGVLLLSGMLVDPSYTGSLHLVIANVGSKRFVISRLCPIAALQFVYVSGTAEKPQTPIESSLAAQFEDREPVQKPVAFLDDLRKLRIEYDELSRDTRRTSELAQTVITFGLILVVATLFGVVVGLRSRSRPTRTL